MNVKVISMLAALAVAVPVVAEAAPAGGLTAQTTSSVATAPALNAASIAPGENNAKVEKVWWRRGGWRGGWGYRRYGWGWRRPFYGYYGWRRPWGWHRRYYW